MICVMITLEYDACATPSVIQERGRQSPSQKYVCSLSGLVRILVTRSSLESMFVYITLLVETSWFPVIFFWPSHGFRDWDLGSKVINDRIPPNLGNKKAFGWKKVNLAFSIETVGWKWIEQAVNTKVIVSATWLSADRVNESLIQHLLRPGSPEFSIQH